MGNRQEQQINGEERNNRNVNAVNVTRRFNVSPTNVRNRRVKA